MSKIMQHNKRVCKDIEQLSSFTTFLVNQVSKALLYGGVGSGEGNRQDMGLYSDSSAICKQGRGNDCVHTCNLRLGFGNLSLPERGTASTAQETGKKGGGELTAFPPSLCHPLPSFFLPICVSHSHSNSAFATARYHQRALVQPVTFSLAPLFSAPLCISNLLKGDGRVPSSCVRLFFSVVYLHADTPIQMISRHFPPREVLRLPVFPPS